MKDNFSIRNWKNTKLYKEEFDSSNKVNEQNNFEADPEDIEFELPGDENAKPVVDKSLNKTLTRQDKVIKSYKDINTQMQNALYAFKNADTDEAKESAKLSLKKLTPAYRSAKEAYEKLKGVKI